MRHHVTEELELNKDKEQMTAEEMASMDIQPRCTAFKDQISIESLLSP